MKIENILDVKHKMEGNRFEFHDFLMVYGNIFSYFERENLLDLEVNYEQHSDLFKMNYVADLLSSDGTIALVHTEYYGDPDYERVEGVLDVYLDIVKMELVKERNGEYGEEHSKVGEKYKKVSKVKFKTMKEFINYLSDVDYNSLAFD